MIESNKKLKIMKKIFLIHSWKCFWKIFRPHLHFIICPSLWTSELFPSKEEVLANPLHKTFVLLFNNMRTARLGPYFSIQHTDCKEVFIKEYWKLEVVLHVIFSNLCRKYADKRFQNIKKYVKTISYAPSVKFKWNTYQVRINWAVIFPVMQNKQKLQMTSLCFIKSRTFKRGQSGSFVSLVWRLTSK